MKSISKAAVLYTLRELGRRAGAALEWIACWRVWIGEGQVTVFPQWPSPARLIFPFDPGKAAHFRELYQVPPSRHRWMSPSETNTCDFIVPFDERAVSGTPLFVQTSPDVVECRADILTSTLWTLSRVEEEWLPNAADSHGRFPAAASAACRFGWLERPIVDEYGSALRQALGCVMPGWTPLPRRFCVKLSHDIDLVGLPPSLRSTAGHIFPRRLPGAFVRDILSLAGLALPAYLEAVVRLARISKAAGFDSAFYWKASPRTACDSGYAPEDPRVRAVIDALGADGFEMGVHPAYSTFDSLPRLQEEVKRLRALLGEGPLGGRQHFLRWRPQTWKAWEAAGLSYDSSVGFADAVGFRAGTAVPYHPWLIEDDRESALLEIPLVVMDCTPTEYLKLGRAATLSRVRSLIARCEAVGGVFTLLWHNSSAIVHPYPLLYREILEAFPSRARYEWRDELAIAPLPRPAAAAL
jgi:hypothetical protein